MKITGVTKLDRLYSNFLTVIRDSRSLNFVFCKITITTFNQHPCYKKYRLYRRSEPVFRHFLGYREQLLVPKNSVYVC